MGGSNVINVDDFSTENFSSSWTGSTHLRKESMPALPMSKSRLPGEDDDLLALVACAATLYSQKTTVKMKTTSSSGTADAQLHGVGATSTVSTEQVTVSKPNTVGSTGHSTTMRVITKHPHEKLFHTNGRARLPSNAHRLITEMRVLSHPGIRSTEEIVKLLGIHWDCTTPESPEPLIVLEYASYDLYKFQENRELYCSLPISTRRNLALDVARGLDALHTYGVIHGDVKPENILVFEGREFHAKIADFSHSLLDTGELRNLVGGTERYAAPEWKRTAPTGMLKKADVYSYGLVFATIILGKDVPSDMIREYGRDSFELFKSDDRLGLEILQRAQMYDQMWNNALLHDPEQVMAVFELTLQTNPGKRDLAGVIGLLAGISFQKEAYNGNSVDEHVAIPFQALQQVSGLVMDCILTALMEVAENKNDSRQASACLHVAASHISGFGMSVRGVIDRDAYYRLAIQYLKRAAELGESTARLICHAVFGAIGADITSDMTHVQWLQEASDGGCAAALSRLRTIDPPAYKNAILFYRNTFCGNMSRVFADVRIKFARLPPLEEVLNDRGDTTLHYLASTNRLALLGSTDFRSQLNNRNSLGETPLLCAVRAGHDGCALALLKAGADASITNWNNESSLHFLANVDNEKVEEIARALVAAGATLSTQARGSSQSDNIQTAVRGIPALRAVASNNAKLVDILLKLELESDASEAGFFTVRASHFREVLSYAVRLHRFAILKVIEHYRPDLELININACRFHDAGQSLPLVALAILGDAWASSDQVGPNWPERFQRMITFGPEYKHALSETFSFLERLGADFQNQECGGCCHAMAFAIYHNRVDALACMMEMAGIGKVAPSIARAVFWHAEERSFGAHGEDPPARSRFVAEPPPIVESQCNGSSNHRYKWPLIEMADYAIQQGRREALSYLVTYKEALALDPGNVRQVAILKKQLGYPSGDHSPLSNDVKLQPATWLRRYCVEDGRGHFPPSGQSFAIAFPIDESDLHPQDTEWEFLDGRLNYSLLFMNSVSCSYPQDISLAHIILDAIPKRGANKQLSWSSAHWFETQCLGTPTACGILSPLLHALQRGWTELARVLLANGASSQDILHDTKDIFLAKTVMSTGLASYETNNHWVPLLLSLAADEAAPEIIVKADIDSLLDSYLDKALKRSPKDVHSTDLVAHGGLQLRSNADAAERTWRDITGVSWTNAGQLDWQGSGDWMPQERELWKALKRANKAQRSPIDADLERSPFVTEAAIQQKYLALETLLGMNFHPDGTLRYRRRELKDPSFLGLSCWNDTSLRITPFDIFYWTSHVPVNQCTEAGLRLKRQNAAMARKLLEHHVKPTRGQEYSMLWHYFIAPLSSIMQDLVIILLLLTLSLVPAAGTVACGAIAWFDLKRGAISAETTIRLDHLWKFFIISNAYIELTIVTWSLAFLGLEFFLYPGCLLAAFFMCFLLPPLYFTFGWGCFFYPTMGFFSLMCLTATLAVGGFGFLLTIGLRYRDPSRLTELARNVHGGSKAAARNAMYSPDIAPMLLHLVKWIHMKLCTAVHTLHMVMCDWVRIYCTNGSLAAQENTGSGIVSPEESDEASEGQSEERESVGRRRVEEARRQRQRASKGGKAVGRYVGARITDAVFLLGGFITRVIDALARESSIRSSSRRQIASRVWDDVDADYSGTPNEVTSLDLLVNDTC